MKTLPDLEQALALLNLGQYKPARRSARAALRRAPRSAQAHNTLGICDARLGDHTAACKSFAKALRLDPGNGDARRNLAQSLIILGRFTDAVDHLQRLIAASPDDTGAWYLLAQSRLAINDIDGAIDAANRAVSKGSQAALGLNLRGLIRERGGDIVGAIADFEAALTADPYHIEALVNLAPPLSRMNRFDDAHAALSKALKLAPDHITARLRLATLHLQSGDNDAAIAAFREVLDRSPANAIAIEQLAYLHPPEQAGQLSGLARSAISHVPKRSEALASLHFALAHLAAQSGETRDSTDHLATANRIMARLMPYDAQGDSALTDRLIARFPTPQTQRHCDDPHPRPIYVVGLPRSGTTLAEAILGAHPQVCALGERIAAGVLLQSFVNNDLPFAEADIERFVDGDRAQLPTLPPGTRAYVDKMPENYRLIGLLKHAYPQARIINIRRDPRDIALSMWKSHFAGTALNYTYDMQAMAHRFNLYARLMAHWHHVLPGQILDLDYADMVRDVEGTGRRMAQFCGFEWQSDMARPHDLAGPVQTLSATQLRQPVHQRSIGTWRKHADTLAPFIAALDPALWPIVQQEHPG